MWHWLSLCLFASFTHAALAALPEFSGTVTRVLDGDTVHVLSPGGRVKVRIAGIDAPEKDQPNGKASRRFLSLLVRGKEVAVAPAGTDQYGRDIAQIYLGDLDVGEEIVQRGWAWAYGQYATDHLLFTFEQLARTSRRGLWADERPMEPWIWRHGGKSKPHAADPYGHSSTAQESADHAHPATLADASFACGTKSRCAQLSTCDEAMFFLVRCGVHVLDKDGDGRPCSRLCR